MVWFDGDGGRGAWLVLAMLAAACGKVDAPDRADTEDASPSTTDGEEEPTEGVDPDGTEGATTDRNPVATEGVSETDGETDAETDGFDPLCFEDPVAEAAFELELGTWTIPPDSDDHYQIDAPCTVLEVQDDGQEIVTSLECDIDGELHTMALHTASTAEGSPTWAPAEVVQLIYAYDYDWRLHEMTYRGASLRRVADDALLVGAVDTDGTDFTDFLEYPANYFVAPVVITDDHTYCGGIENPFEVGELSPMRVHLGLDAQVLSLVSGQEGVLTLAGTSEVLAVDVEEATAGYCCSTTTEWHRILVQRVG